MHAVSSYRGNRPTNTHTHTHTQPPLKNPQTGPITIHCAAASAQCKIEKAKTSKVTHELQFNRCGK